MPELPTLHEIGYKDFNVSSEVSLLAPKGTSREIIARLNAESAKVLAQADVKARFAELGLETVGSTPAQFDQWIKTEIERWGQVIRAQKIVL